MKRVKFIAIATWMIEHLTFVQNSEALAGDLLEELKHGRSARWYCRQVFSAISAGARNKVRDLASPLIFCALWSSLYPGWNLLSRPMLARFASGGPIVAAWPYSALLPLSFGLAPALVFVWLGFLVYVVLHPGTLREGSAQRLILGLSTSLNVLLVSTYLLLRHFKHSRIDLGALMREDFYSAFHLLSISVPLALSLLTALLFTVSHTPRVIRRGRLPRLLSVRRAQQIMQAFCFVLVLSGASSILGQAAANPPAAQLIAVDKDVKLEVLGLGRNGETADISGGLGKRCAPIRWLRPKVY